MEAKKLKIYLGILNRGFFELSKVKDDIHSPLLSQHAKDIVTRYLRHIC